MTQRELRERPKHQSLRDWSDEDPESPEQQPKRRGSKEHGPITRFARKGVSNANFDKPPSSKRHRSSDSEDDPISDSEASDREEQEEEQPKQRRARQGKSVNYAESPVSGKGTGEEEKGSEVSEDEKLQQQEEESSEDSGSSSEGSGSGSEGEEEDSPPRQRGRRPAARQGNGSGRGRGRARSLDGIAARPRRGAAAGPKKYNDNDSEDAIEESKSERQSSDEEEVKEQRQRRSAAKAGRKAGKGGQRRGEGGRLRRAAAAKKGSPPKPTRRSGRHGERTVSYAEDDADMDVYYEAESSDESGSDSEGGSFDSSEENHSPRPKAKPAKGAGAKGKAKGKSKASKAAAAGKKRRTVVASESEQEESEEEEEEEGSGSDSEEHGSDSGSDASEPELDYSRLKVEKILDSREAEDGSGEEFRVKFQGKSYRRTAWLPYDVLAADRQQLLRNFQKRKAEGGVDEFGDTEEGVHPDWLEVDRVIARRGEGGRARYLVKWQGLGYAESTWESAASLKHDKAHIERFERFSTPPEDDDDACIEEVAANRVPTFCNGRALRDYQKVSLQWMANNCEQRINCILGDEMGLGKTAQSISVLAFQHQFRGVRGPFLVIAPLTTLGHWQREIETWTDMNCLVYAGGKEDRAVISKYDLWLTVPGKGRIVKPNVVLASYETVLKEGTLFKGINWETVIIDEAHRMKSTNSSTRTVITQMDIEWLLLLTGTPVQNNMRELFGILNLLDPAKFGDEEEFMDTYTDPEARMRPEQVAALQEVLRPLLLRRMKEDVETLPEKEEVIIWVELTTEQRAYYRAIYEKQIGTLLAGSSNKNLPNLKNLAMELRKVCCHPYLCNGLEEDIAMRRAAKGETATERELLVQASGKMVLLNKLLPKLRSEGHKVLVFSQFKIMLDVLEDYLRLCNYPVERIDGSTAGRDRQAAIDRYSKEGSDGFVFLLSTRAGGQGITLTAADTVIIYDSDWNPQNDLQAMARCHRIGQDKEVTIYRLVSRDTYEQHVFETSSRKYGLDEAILGGMGSSGDDGSDPELNSKKITDLLKHGAHCLHTMDAANEQTEAFASEGIDDILNKRTEKRQIGNRAGNSFSVATFTVNQEQAGDDKSYWATLLPDAAQSHAEAVAAAKAGPIMLAPRRRKKVNYIEEAGLGRGRGRGKFDDSDDSDYKGSGDASDDETIAHQGKRRRSEAGEGKEWSGRELKALEERLIALGPGRTQEVQQQAGLLQRPLEEVQAVEQALVALIERAVTLVPRQERHHNRNKDKDAAGAPGAAAPGAAVPDGESGKENGAPAAAPKPAPLPDVELITPDMQLPKLASKIISAKDTTARLLYKAHKYHDALVERRALAALVATATPDQPFQPPRVSGKGCGLPYWWEHPADDRSLLEGLHQLGWGVSQQHKRDVEAILQDKRYGFASRVQHAPAAAPPPAPVPAAASAAPGGELGLALGSSLPQPPAPAPAAPPAPLPSALGGLGQPIQLDDKGWKKLCDGVSHYVRRVLTVIARPEEAAAEALKESQRKQQQRAKPFRPTGVLVIGPSMAGQQGAPEGSALAGAGMGTGMHRVLSRHDSNQPEGGPSNKGPSPGTKRPASGENPAGAAAAAAEQPRKQQRVDAAGQGVQQAKSAGSEVIDLISDSSQEQQKAAAGGPSGAPKQQEHKAAVAPPKPTVGQGQGGAPQKGASGGKAGSGSKKMKQVDLLYYNRKHHERQVAASAEAAGPAAGAGSAPAAQQQQQHP